MQPELHDNSQNATTQEIYPDSHQYHSQHGLQHEPVAPPALFSGGGQGGVELPSEEGHAVSDTPGSRRVDNDPQEATRLNTAATPAGKKIEDYERSLTSSPRRKPEGPVFEVIKKGRKPGDKTSPIANLPNGMLA